jgi:hypothetical protein
MGSIGKNFGNCSPTRPTCRSQGRRGSKIWLFLPIFSLLAGLISPQLAAGYSWLTHEQVIDILWKDELKPLLLKRFPEASEKELQKAHAYAYGGCLVQDMGYYPLGNKYFSDLTHYVRSGDFVANLIGESTNLNEYAYALGALAHYCADNTGHPSINRAVALSFPKLRKKFGDSVTYADDPKSHIRVEFGFDMTQVAKNRYTSDSYHDFIGFEVSKPLLARAFLKTYNVPLEDVLHPVDLSIGTFRRAVSQLIPQLTRVALEVQRPETVKDRPNRNEKRFRYLLSRSEYEKEWGKDYRKPGFVTRVLGFILKWIPKIGPLKALAFKIPTSQTEDIYFKSVNDTVEKYRKELRGIGGGQLKLPNLDFDTAREPRLGEYPLSDKTYARLLDDLTKKGLAGLSPDLRENILGYYSRGSLTNIYSRKERKAWEKIQVELTLLKRTTAESSATPAGRNPTSRIIHGERDEARDVSRKLALKSPKVAAE